MFAHQCPSRPPKISLPLFSQPEAVRFFFMHAGIPVCIHLFPPNRGKENKNIINGLGEITGCQSSETQSVCVCALNPCALTVD